MSYFIETIGSQQILISGLTGIALITGICCLVWREEIKQRLSQLQQLDAADF